MKVKYTKGAMVGGLIGALVWLASAFLSLPPFVYYLSQLWLVKPISKLFELGAAASMVTMLLVCIISFAVYGVLVNMLLERLRSLRK